jgi:hypothetical protein
MNYFIITFILHTIPKFIFINTRRFFLITFKPVEIGLVVEDPTFC